MRRTGKTDYLVRQSGHDATIKAMGQITGAIIGVGSARRISAVRWNIAKDIVIAWVVTLPAAAIIGGLSYWVAGLFL